jgi:hypothetical protein
MKITIKCESLHYAFGMVKCVTNRDHWKGEQSGGYLGLVFEGSGTSLQGRSVDVKVNIDNDGGEAVMEVDAPGSQGGFLATLLEEMVGQHETRRDGERPSEAAELPGLEVTIDGAPARWEWEEIDLGGIWWRRLRTSADVPAVAAV